MKILKIAVAVFIVVSGIGVLAGCQTAPSSNVRYIPNENIDATNPRARLVIGSEGLIGNIAIVDPRFRQLGQLSQAQVTVQNLTDGRYTLEYRVSWEDAQGFKVGNIGTWHRFTVTPKQLQSFTSTGKTPEATNIIFTIRLPDDVFINADRKQP